MLNLYLCQIFCQLICLVLRRSPQTVTFVGTYIISICLYFCTFSQSIQFYCIFQVFNIRYPNMHKVQGAKCAISY